MRGDEEREDLITSGLRSYAEPGEIPEARAVLARVKEQARAEQTRRKRIWAWAIPVTACAMAALLMGFIGWQREPQTPQIAWTPPAPVPKVEAMSNSPVAAPRHAPHATVLRVATAQPEPLPKLNVFPSPKPLTPGEQALATLARPAQAAVTHQVLEAQKHLDDPIDIADLKIRPLAIGDDEVPPTGKEKR